jgi:hypothetical protein
MSDALSGLLWSLALILGGLSVVAAMIARREWRRFEEALNFELTPDTGDTPYLRHRDFRYWHRIGIVTAGLSVLCSMLWFVL